jgi:hypothetical protein
MHTAGLKTGTRSVSASSKNDVKKGTMTTMAPIMTNHTDSALSRGGKPGGVRAYSDELNRVRCPLNFKPSGIEKYDGSTNPAKWLEVYQLTIKATGGDSYIMENYLQVCLSSSARTSLLGLPTGLINS